MKTKPLTKNEMRILKYLFNPRPWTPDPKIKKEADEMNKKWVEEISRRLGKKD